MVLRVLRFLELVQVLVKAIYGKNNGVILVKKYT